MSANLAPVKATPKGESTAPGRGLWAAAWHRLIRKPTAVFGLGWVAMIVFVALFADKLARYDYAKQNYDAVQRNPFSPGHLFGTDTLGRDILTRMMYGARVSMSVAAVVLLIGLIVGMALGALAAYYGGTVDMLIMRLTDVMFAFPGLLLAILIMGIRGQGLTNLYIAMGVTAWPGMARLVRGQMLALKETEYVQAAHSLGSHDSRIIVKHLIPNVLSPVLVASTLELAGVILAEASLSFLGIGVKPPYPSWGSIINEMVALIYSQPRLLIAPALVLALTVLAFNFLGDGLRDALDPRLKQ